MKRAYIATRLENHVKYAEVREALAGIGVGISYDWTVHGPAWTEGQDRIREVSILEMKGVQDSDFSIVILPGGRGTHCELGMALASKKQVFILSESPTTTAMFGATPETCAFYHHPLVVWTFGIPQLIDFVEAMK